MQSSRRLHALCEEEKALLLRPSHLDHPQAISSGRYRMNRSCGEGVMRESTA
jgi:hypothetical protein